MHVVTVSHVPELAALKLQARSIARHAAPDLFDSIMVIINQVDPIEFQERFAAEVLPEYGSYRSKVQLIGRDKLKEMPHWIHGWRSQQLLKLLAARLCQTGDILILDSKNHFAREINTETYKGADGRARAWAVHHRGHMEQYFRASMEAFDLPIEENIDHWIPTVTPILFPVEDVLGCLDALASRFPAGFDEVFLQGQCRMTEFFLISAYQLKKYKTLDTRYVFGKPHSAILFQDKVADLNRFGSTMFAADQPHTSSFAIHHAAFSLLTEPQKTRIAEFWLRCGLIAELTEAASFLTPPYAR